MDPDELYEAIRADQDDVEIIAGRIGWKPANVAKVKTHLFHQIHLLDKYEPIGVPAHQGRFDSDPVIAESWQRLKNGDYRALDLQLMRHECRRVLVYAEARAEL